MKGIRQNEREREREKEREEVKKRKEKRVLKQACAGLGESMKSLFYADREERPCQEKPPLLSRCC